MIYISIDNNVYLNELYDFNLEEISKKDISCKTNLLGLQECTEWKMNTNEFAVIQLFSKHGFIINKSNLLKNIS